MDQRFPQKSISDGISDEDRSGANSPECPSEDVFDRFLAGTVSEEERTCVELYVKSRNDERLLLPLIRPASFYLAPQISAKGNYKAVSDFEAEVGGRMWSSIVSDLAQNSRADFPVETSRNYNIGELKRPQSGHKFAKRPLWTASLFAGALIAVAAWFGVSYDAGNPQEYAGNEMQSDKTLVTARGQRVTYHLPDGSSVLLAPNSKLKYSETFGLRNRTVTLEGEALFTVTQDGGMPFVVTSGSASVRVLGTTFSVRRYQGDSLTSIVVAEGKVSVGADILTSGTSLVMADDGSVEIERAAAISSELAWTNGTLVFQRTNFSDVIDQLERWLDIDVIISDKALLQRQITGEFLVSEPDAVISSISSILNAKVVRTGKRISFIPLQ